MPSYDRITGDYFLETLRDTSGSANFTITVDEGRGQVLINGNLVVAGVFSRVESVQTLIYDNFITLNADAQGIWPYEDAGIEVARGLLPNVSLTWNEQIDWWQFTNDGYVYWKMLRFIKDDPDPHLGGHLYTDCYEIRSSDPCNIILTPGWTGAEANAAIQITHTYSPTANVAYVEGATVLYGMDVGNGQSGLYITDKKARKEELITKRRALVYSLVL